MTGWRQDFSAFDLPPGCEPCGSLEEWSSAANMLFATGCEAQSVMLLASFAAPLMALWEASEEGAIVAIHGARRSGKSVAIYASATVWGLPDALRQASGAALEARWAAQPHLPVIDEKLMARDPGVAQRIVESFVTRHPSIMLLANSTKLPFEAPGLDLAVAVPRGLIAPKDGDHLIDRLMENRGTAGSAYLGRIAQPRVLLWAQKRMAAKAAEIRDDCPELAPRRHLIRAIAACHVAGTLATEAKIIEYEVERITRWVFEAANG